MKAYYSSYRFLISIWKFNGFMNWVYFKTFQRFKSLEPFNKITQALGSDFLTAVNKSTTTNSSSKKIAYPLKSRWTDCKEPRDFKHSPTFSKPSSVICLQLLISQRKNHVTITWKIPDWQTGVLWNIGWG